MRPRYFVILLLMVSLCIAGYRASEHLHDLRTLPTVQPDPAVVANLERRPMPARASELGDDLQRLQELKQDDLLAAITAYQHQQRLSEVLGMPADRVATLGMARDWLASHPGRIERLGQQIMREAVEISLAPSELPPPRAGRSGVSWNMGFKPLGEGLWLADQPAGNARPYYVLVVQVRNALRLPLAHFSLAVMPRGGDTLSTNPLLPPRSYVWCEVEGGSGLAAPIAPGAALPVLCEVRASAAESVPVEVLQQLLRDLRMTGIEPWTRSVEFALEDSRRMSSLKVEDLGVSAEFGHGPSARVVAGLYSRQSNESGPPRPYQFLTTCAERGDCARERLVPFEGLVSNLWTLMALLVPGYLVAGFSRLRSAESHGFGVLVFSALAIAVVPYAFHEAGGAYGPLAALFLLAYSALGYWLGYGLGRWSARG